MAHKHSCLNCDKVIAEGNFDCELDRDHDFALCDECAGVKPRDNMETKHTPGPWKVGTKHPCRVIGGHDLIAYCCEPFDEGTEYDWQKANAHLIAKAWLLPEVERVLELFSGEADGRPHLVDSDIMPVPMKWLRDARALLAKLQE